MPDPRPRKKPKTEARKQKVKEKLARKRKESKVWKRHHSAAKQKEKRDKYAVTLSSEARQVLLDAYDGIEPGECALCL
jgi:hypothetical protein